MEEIFLKKKSLGQHFLTSAVVPQWMCDAAEVTAGDVVVEIGPGTGVLTKELLARGATVIALEADTRAIAVLNETFKEAQDSGSLIVHHTDVRHFDIASLELATQTFKVVANIPYYLSGMLFRTFLTHDIQPTTLVFLVQKEVARRITTTISSGEKESLLSLSVKVYGEPAYVRTVSKGHFSPPPKVDSGIVLVQNIGKDNFAAISEDSFFEILHLGFGQKRKQLFGNLSKQYDKKRLTTAFSTLSIPLNIRAEDLALKTWIALTHALTHSV